MFLPTEEDVNNSLQFCHEVRDLVERSSMGAIEAVCYVAEEHGVEPEYAADLLNAALKEQIRLEAQNLHLLAKSPTLPF